MTLRVFSFGGGVQSVAALVLAGQGRIDFRDFVFAQVGADSESPQTLAYLEAHARPYATAHGLTIHEVSRKRRDGTADTLLDYVMRDTRSLKLPTRDETGHPGRRGCTGDFKITPIARWLKQRGATAEDPAVSGMGISLDESHRMRRESGFAWSVLAYPLIDLRLTRAACRRVIEEAGLPIPPKSACWFCPFHPKAAWTARRRDDPALFEQAADFEEVMRARSVQLGRGPVYLTAFGKPLRDAIPLTGQVDLFASEPAGAEDDPDDTTDACETGYCMT